MTAAAVAPTRVVWDFGAVLFNWRPAALLQRVLPTRALDEASTAHWVAQFFQAYSGDWGEFDRGAVDVPTLVQRISARTGLSAAEVLAVVDAVPAELQPLPTSVALVQRLHSAGVVQHYLSNMPAPYAVHLLQHHAFLGRLHSGVFSSDVKLIKPDPAIFALAATSFGVPASQLLFFDDHPANVQAARAAGWQAELFLGVDAAEQAQAALQLRGLL
jgi:putative hydrolase of the HAD superfamily